MRLFVQFAVLMCLLSACKTNKQADSPAAAFSEPPPAPPHASPPVSQFPELAPEWVKEKAHAAYAKSYWFQIYPKMRSCTKVGGAAGYVATFTKSGAPLVGFREEDTQWHAIRVEFDDELRIKNIHPVMY